MWLMNGITDWTSGNAELRQDEVWVFVDMLNAISDTLALGWNVLPHQYAQLAEEIGNREIVRVCGASRSLLSNNKLGRRPLFYLALHTAH